MFYSFSNSLYRLYERTCEAIIFEAVQILPKEQGERKRGIVVPRPSKLALALVFFFFFDRSLEIALQSCLKKERRKKCEVTRETLIFVGELFLETRENEVETIIGTFEIKILFTYNYIATRGNG